MANKYELRCCSNPPPPIPTTETMALCVETAALFIIKSMNYGLKVTDAVICLLITILSPETACIVSPHPPPVFGPNCLV